MLLFLFEVIGTKMPQQRGLFRVRKKPNITNSIPVPWAWLGGGPTECVIRMCSVLHKKRRTQRTETPGQGLGLGHRETPR